ncbi:MAG: hypothetical protein AAGA68_14115 [Pseudomonadota bacterium]
MTRLIPIAALIAILGLVSLPHAYAARPVQPPLTEFTTNPYNQVMAGRVVEKIAPNKVRLERQVAYAGDVAASVILRIEDEETFAEVREGQSYIIAFSYFTSDPQFRESKYEDPEGPRMIRLRGLGTSALFEDTPETRFLFESASGEAQPDPRDVLEALTRQMVRPDPRTQSLVVVELLLRRDLHASVLPPQAERVAEVVSNPEVVQELRAFLLEAAVAFPDRSQRWLREACRQVIAALEPDFALETHGPQLATAVLVAMADHGAAEDVQAMVPFLASNAPKVVRAAIESIEIVLLRAGRASPSL